MAGRGTQTFKKRQKEQQRKERQQEKFAKRLQKKLEPRTGTPMDELPPEGGWPVDPETGLPLEMEDTGEPVVEGLDPRS